MLYSDRGCPGAPPHRQAWPLYISRILNNSTIRLLFVNVLLLCCLLSTACAGDLSDVKIECIKKTLDTENVKVDNKNQRLFVADKNLTAHIFSSKLNKIKLCLKNSSWDSDWAISVFTEEKYAGYKDDKNIIPFHKNNEWAKAYKIEYLNSSGIIIKNPALSPKEIRP